MGRARDSGERAVPGAAPNAHFSQRHVVCSPATQQNASAQNLFLQVLRPFSLSPLQGTRDALSQGAPVGRAESTRLLQLAWPDGVGPVELGRQRSSVRGRPRGADMFP